MTDLQAWQVPLEPQSQRVVEEYAGNCRDYIGVIFVYIYIYRVYMGGHTKNMENGNYYNGLYMQGRIEL